MGWIRKDVGSDKRREIEIERNKENKRQWLIERKKSESEKEKERD